MKEVLVNTLMTNELTCLEPDAPLSCAIDWMIKHRFSCVIVTRKDIPVGIVTERDLVKVLARDAHEIDLSLPVADFMSSPVLSLREDESLFDALVVSRAERVRHLPVVNEAEQLVGLVTQATLANAHFHVTEMQAEVIQKSIADKTRDLQKANEELQALSMEDHLMEVGNRRAMEVDLAHTHAGAVRHEQPYSILLLDVDHFKLYNDHYGHQAGDDALKKIAYLLKTNIRASDRLYRYGGEELLLLLPHTNPEQAEWVAQKMIHVIDTGAIPHQKSPYNQLTISVGGACVFIGNEFFDSWEAVIEHADQCLYQAKDQGRNRAVVALVHTDQATSKCSISN